MLATLAFLSVALAAYAADSPACTQLCSCISSKVPDESAAVKQHLKAAKELIKSCSNQFAPKAAQAGKVYKCLEQKFHSRCQCAKDMHDAWVNSRRKRMAGFDIPKMKRCFEDGAGSIPVETWEKMEKIGEQVGECIGAKAEEPEDAADFAACTAQVGIDGPAMEAVGAEWDKLKKEFE